MRLHVGVFGPVDFLYTVDSELLHLVDNLASAIVAVSGIAFGIFVGEA